MPFGRRSCLGRRTLCLKACRLQLGCGCSSLSCGLLLGQFLLGGSLARSLLTLFIQTLRFLLRLGKPCSFLSGSFQTRGFLLHGCNASRLLACRL